MCVPRCVREGGSARSEISCRPQWQRWRHPAEPGACACRRGTPRAWHRQLCIKGNAVLLIRCWLCVFNLDVPAHVQFSDSIAASL